MKYYLYISDAKVDMLLPQISDAGKKKISTKFGIDLKVLQASRTSEFTANDGRIARLEAVTSFIREFGNLGNADKSDEYIEDSLPMYTTFMSHRDISGRVVYFSADHGNNFVALGGSEHHLIGANPQTLPQGHNSVASMVMIAVNAAFKDLAMDALTHDLGFSSVMGLNGQFRLLKYPLENLGFMAKRLLMKQRGEDPHPKTQVFLGTPLYVCKED
jgi:hypothetical protein